MVSNLLSSSPQKLSSTAADYSPSIDTSDVQFQRNKDDKPDKDHLWKGPMKEDGWVHAHNAIRGEVEDIKNSLGLFPKNFPGGATAWAIDLIQSIWKEHEKHVLSHHMNEDNIMTPFMSSRINLPDKLEEDHKQIVDRMKRVGALIETMKEGDSIDGVMSALLAYEEVLLPHLLEEEQVALPLCRAYFTPDEVKAQVRKMSFHGPPVEMGSFIYYMREDHFRTQFMKHEGIPTFLWWLVMKPNYKYFMKHMKEPLDAIRTGRQPAVDASGCLGWM